MILPVIIAGGSGTRLWPLSRSHYPKQFLSLTNDKTMLQNTAQRIQNLPHRSPLFICNYDHRFIVAEQLRTHDIANSGIILEPVGKNTAPAIALAALKAISDGDDPLLLILAADHFIENTDKLVETIKESCKYAMSGKLITFGVIPSKPETGYGYIKRGEPVGTGYNIDQFVEKPEVDTATKYYESGEYYWNSGMFLFKASVYIRELEKFYPEVISACKNALDKSKNEMDFIKLDEHAFALSPDISIDYAVMENTSEAMVFPLDVKWSDVGSWSALWDISHKDIQGNAVRGDIITTGTTNSYIYSKDRLVSTVGVDNLIVIDTKDAVLVANKDNVQDVKVIVNTLKATKRPESIQHREAYFPWGTNDSIAEGIRYQVKHLMVKPGHEIPTQLHYHRAEHWVVVSGTALVSKDEENIIVTENESIYIPIGVAHSIENVGKIPLKIIEIRSGNYLGDDDVVLFNSDLED